MRSHRHAFRCLGVQRRIVEDRLVEGRLLHEGLVERHLIDEGLIEGRLFREGLVEGRVLDVGLLEDGFFHEGFVERYLVDSERVGHGLPEGRGVDVHRAPRQRLTNEQRLADDRDVGGRLPDEQRVGDLGRGGGLCDDLVEQAQVHAAQHDR